MAKEARAAASPEVQAFEWLDVGTVAGAAFSSMNTAFTPINAFQVRLPTASQRLFSATAS